VWGNFFPPLHHAPTPLLGYVLSAIDLKAEVEKGSVSTANGHGLGDPKRWGKPVFLLTRVKIHPPSPNHNNPVSKGKPVNIPAPPRVERYPSEGREYPPTLPSDSHRQRRQRPMNPPRPLGTASHDPREEISFPLNRLLLFSGKPQQKRDWRGKILPRNAWEAWTHPNIPSHEALEKEGGVVRGEP